MIRFVCYPIVKWRGGGMETRTGREVRVRGGGTGGGSPLASGFEGSSRAKNFRFNFLLALSDLRRDESVWTERGQGAYRLGVTRRRVRELARQHARVAAKK